MSAKVDTSQGCIVSKVFFPCRDEWCVINNRFAGFDFADVIEYFVGDDIFWVVQTWIRNYELRITNDSLAFIVDCNSNSLFDSCRICGENQELTGKIIGIDWFRSLCNWCWSCCDSLPMTFFIRRLSNVNILNLITDDDVNPVDFKLVIMISLGHIVFLPVVIMEKMVCWFFLLNILVESTTAGRGFDLFLSTKGNGMIAISAELQIIVSLIVFFWIPLRCECGL